ncbi:MAG: hypothetical protein JKY37_07845, partial [Nannocystaceae bacterium]|nr:hypothetical protein [Nannocystaceae bacterium]
MARPPRDEPGRAPRATRDAALQDIGSAALDLVNALDQTFRQQVKRALKVDLDGSVESLAFVDHYLHMAKDEPREPIVGLVAAGAGAYFGALVSQTMGAVWAGDARNPRRLRLLMAPQLIHFSPVDQAYEAIASRALSPDDPRIADGPAFDPIFHLGAAAASPESEVTSGDATPGVPEKTQAQDDASWLEERLGELAPVPEDQFYSLTGRFETLQLMLELLAAKHGNEGR